MAGQPVEELISSEAENASNPAETLASGPIPSEPPKVVGVVPTVFAVAPRFVTVAGAREYRTSRGIEVRRAAGLWQHGDHLYDDDALIAWANRKYERALRHGGA